MGKGLSQQKVIGARIRKLRKAKKLSLAQLAGKAEMSASFLCELETGRYSDMQLSTARDIAKALGATLAEILGLEAVNTPPEGSHDPA